MSQLALRVHDLHKAYGRHQAVQGLSFEVRPGELACLIGPNGAGKSTTMRTIAGLQARDSGELEIGGVSVESAAEAKERCALTPQDLSMFEHLTGQETLQFVAAIRGVSDQDRDERIAHWLELTGLEASRDRMVREYSGGMKRKLAVASAMIAEPPLVLLDESFTGLDPESTRALQLELRRYCDRGGAILLSSHILDMVQTMADRVIFMAQGRCVGAMDRAELAREIPDNYPDLTELYLSATGQSAAP